MSPPKKSSTCEPRKNLALLSIESWLVNEDLYIMVYEINRVRYHPLYGQATMFVFITSFKWS